MARFSRLHPVNTEKHEITGSFIGQDASTVQQLTIAKGVDAPSANLSTEVVIGSHVRWIYFEINMSAEDVVTTTILHWNITKYPFGTVVTSPNTYNAKDKRFVLKRGMEMLPKSAGTVIKRIFVVKIPPRLSRLGDEDKLVFSYIASGTNLVNLCFFAVYKAIK